MKTILLDVGNTSVTFAEYGGGRFSGVGSCLYGDIPKYFNKWCQSGRNGSEVLFVLSSVVPKITQKVKALVSRKKGCSLWVIGGNLKVPLKHRYKNVSKLGSDRVLNLYGAMRIYKPPFLVLDFGTAITADYMSAKGVFEGGMIIPGPEIAFQALLDRAALIPKKIRLPEKSVSFLGTDTYSCIRTGILQGYGSMADELIARFRSRYGSKLKVIATGGFARHLRPYTKSFQIFDPLHSLKSLLIISKDKLAGRI